jgi:hypothetical protein
MASTTRDSVTFVNKGLEHWEKGRKEWLERVQSDEMKKRPAPVDIDIDLGNE